MKFVVLIALLAAGRILLAALILFAIASACNERPLPIAPCLPASKKVWQEGQETRPAGYAPAFSVATFESELPILVIDTAGEQVMDEPKIAATLTVFWHPNEDQPNRLSDVPERIEEIAIEIRGYSSQAKPKKQFGFEVRDTDGQDKDVALLSMAAEADWVLNGTFSDPTVMRNAAGYALAREFGRWQPETQHVEVFLNQSGQELDARDYLGLFVLTERIEQSQHRIDLPPTSPTAAPEAGAYLFEMTQSENVAPGEPHFCGRYSGEHYALIHPDSPTDEQLAWAEQFIAATERQALQTRCDRLESMIDMEVFADYVLFNELFQNVDGLIRSMFIQKQPEGPLVVWPIWDLDLTLTDNDPLDAWYLAGRTWLGPIGKCRDFRELVASRWQAHRKSIFLPEHIDDLLSAMAHRIRAAGARNLERWPACFEEHGYAPSSVPEEVFDNEVESLRTRLLTKAEWLDQQVSLLVKEGFGSGHGEWTSW